MTTVINQRGRHPGKKLRHAEYTESERFPLENGRDFAREIYEDSTVVFEVQQARDSVRQRSSNGTCNPSSVINSIRID